MESLVRLDVLLPGGAFYDEVFDRDRIVLQIYVFYVVTGTEV